MCLDYGDVRIGIAFSAKATGMDGVARLGAGGGNHAIRICVLTWDRMLRHVAFRIGVGLSLGTEHTGKADFELTRAVICHIQIQTDTVDTTIPQTS